GHSHTHEIVRAGKLYAVDTGFIVFNDRTYPNFINLLNKLNVASQPSSMSFSVKCENSRLEYNGTSLNALFAQRSNLFKPGFYRMIRDILRFNRESLELVAEGAEIGLGDYLKQQGYSQQFIDYYIIPMAAAIWSGEPARMLRFPARFLVRFFHHHGMLTVDDRPQWRVIQGGSARYVEALTAGFIERIRLNTPVTRVRRLKDAVRVTPQGSEEECFDWVFFACHSDQALRLLEDPSEHERDILAALPYQENNAVLHSDSRMLPRRKLAWAAWNYHVPKTPLEHVAVTYNLNILQGLDAIEPLLVTLNYTAGIEDEKIIKRLTYDHPVFTLEGIRAQRRHAEISGVNRTGFCGAYWRNGFHEDGVGSALAALEQFRGHA
ncbi:MAG: NAD(P)/FAD-dependent oxidoreductase, partial [Methylococcales bacterium]